MKCEHVFSVGFRLHKPVRQNCNCPGQSLCGDLYKPALREPTYQHEVMLRMAAVKQTDAVSFVCFSSQFLLAPATCRGGAIKQSSYPLLDIGVQLEVDSTYVSPVSDIGVQVIITEQFGGGFFGFFFPFCVTWSLPLLKLVTMLLEASVFQLSCHV